MAVRILLATAAAPPHGVSGNSTTNSSPPKRATRSDSRSWLCMQRVVSLSNRLPASWPYLSLMVFKLSESIISRAKGRE
ncbi:hypothetical protein D3C83_47220 [compost metagenome]